MNQPAASGTGTDPAVTTGEAQTEGTKVLTEEELKKKAEEEAAKAKAEAEKGMAKPAGSSG